MVINILVVGRPVFRMVGHLVFPKHYTSGSGRVRYQQECAFLLATGEPPMEGSPVSDVIPWTTYTGNKIHPHRKLCPFSNP